MMTEAQMAKITKERTVKAIKNNFGVKSSVRHYGIDGQTIH